MNFQKFVACSSLILLRLIPSHPASDRPPKVARCHQSGPLPDRRKRWAVRIGSRTSGRRPQASLPPAERPTRQKLSRVDPLQTFPAASICCPRTQQHAALQFVPGVARSTKRPASVDHFILPIGRPAGSLPRQQHRCSQVVKRKQPGRCPYRRLGASTSDGMVRW